MSDGLPEGRIDRTGIGDIAMNRQCRIGRGNCLEGLGQQVAVLLRELAVHGGTHRILQILILLPARIVAAQAHRAIRRDGVFRDGVAGLEHVAAVERDVHRHRLVRVQVLQ